MDNWRRILRTTTKLTPPPPANPGELTFQQIWAAREILKQARFVL